MLEFRKIRVLAIVTCIGLIQSCGSDTKRHVLLDDASAEDVVLTSGLRDNVYSGDEIHNLTPNTTVKITYQFEQNVKTVEVLTGKILLVRANAN